jgi:hypothetical protein
LTNSLHPTDSKELNIKDHKCFFVGGIKTKIDNKEIVKGTMYVEQFTPQNQKSNHKIFLFMVEGKQEPAS